MAGVSGVGDARRPWRTVAVPVTSTRDGFEHLVTEDAIAPSNASRYAALCGRDVWTAALAAPPGPRCPACVAVRNADTSDGPRHRRPTRSGAWARLTGLLRRQLPPPREPGKHERRDDPPPQEPRDPR
jgi:hypothetical protein